MFGKNYLDNFSLSQCAKFTGISNGSAAVYWGSFMRENFKGHYHRHLKSKVLHGVIEIDESLFAR